jgi:hypothetical protein
MPDDADELILKMQHLEAQAREQEKARAGADRASKLKTRAQKLAFEAQQEVTAAEEAQRAAEEKHAPDEARDAHTRLVKARARLNFFLDQMDEAERQEWEVLQADARAEAHGQMAEDPLFNKPQT